MIKNLREDIENGINFNKLLEKYKDNLPHLLCGIIRHWFSELKEPPIPNNFFDDFIKISRIENNNELLLSKLNKKILKLSKKNYILLNYFLKGKINLFYNII
jgi:hypothetical protein